VRTHCGTWTSTHGPPPLPQPKPASCTSRWACSRTAAAAAAAASPIFELAQDGRHSQQREGRRRCPWNPLGSRRCRGAGGTSPPARVRSACSAAPPAHVDRRRPHHPRRFGARALGPAGEHAGERVAAQQQSSPLRHVCEGRRPTVSTITCSSQPSCLSMCRLRATRTAQWAPCWS